MTGGRGGGSRAGVSARALVFDADPAGPAGAEWRAPTQSGLVARGDAEVVGYAEFASGVKVGASHDRSGFVERVENHAVDVYWKNRPRGAPEDDDLREAALAQTEAP